MSSLDKCPFCGSSKVFWGSIDCDEGGSYYFIPDQAKVPLWKMVISKGISFGPTAQICAKCDKVWAHADPREAARFVERFGNDEAKAALAARDSEDQPPEPPPPRRSLSP